jgi:hypothetical protein
MLYHNDVIQIHSNKTQYRIVHLDYRENEAWLYPLFGERPFPVFALASELEQKEQEQQLKVISGTEQDIHFNPSKKAIRDRDIAFERIQPLIQTLHIFIPSDRNLLIKKRAAELACSENTLRRLLRLYWAGGQTRNALLPNYHKRGSTKGCTSNRGRPPEYENRGIYQVTPEDIAIFIKVIESNYLKSSTATIQGTFDAMELESYSVVTSEGKLIPKAPGEAPSINQFRRFLKSRYSIETITREREGNAEFELNHASKLGDAELSIYTAGDNFEIDATVADVYLVFSHDKTRIVGKPTLYFVVDSKTWLIVGFYIGFELPSWPAALQAVVSIAEDKETLCKRYGVRYRADDWPAHEILPKEFTADRGSEFISKESERLADELEISVRNLPSKQANRKAHVECSFKLIQRPMAQHVPGYEPPENYRKRQGKHYEQDACLTLNEFTTIILKAIIRFNNSARDDYPLTPAQILDGLIPTPCNLWNHEIRTRAGALSRYPAQFIWNALLSREEVSVTDEGIRFRGCFYTSPEAIERGWFERARRGVFKVTVSFDRRLADEILIHDDLNPGKSFIASLSEKSAHFRGLSFQEIAALAFERERIRRDGQQVTKRQKFSFHSAVDPITKAAFTEVKQLSKGKSRTARKKDIREQRAVELALERQEKAVLSSDFSQQSTAEIVQLPLPNPNLAPTNKTGKRNSRLMEMLNGGE